MGKNRIETLKKIASELLVMPEKNVTALYLFLSTVTADTDLESENLNRLRASAARYFLQGLPIDGVDFGDETIVMRNFSEDGQRTLLTPEELDELAALVSRQQGTAWKPFFEHDET